MVQTHSGKDKDIKWRYFSLPNTKPNAIFNADFYRQSTLKSVSRWSWSLLPAMPKHISQVSSTVWSYVPGIPKFAKFKRYDKIGSLASKTVSKAWENVYTPPWPYQMEEYLMLNPGLSLIAEALSKDIRISFNLAPIVAFSPNDKVAQPFEVDHKPIKQLLITKNNEGKFEIILLDQDDAGYFKKQLEDSLVQVDDPPSALSDMESADDMTRFIETDSDLKVCLYDVRLGLCQQGRFPFTEEELQSEDLQLLLVQAKFLAGATSYTSKEKQLLKNWVETHDSSKIKASYEKQSRKRANYGHR